MIAPRGIDEDFTQHLGQALRQCDGIGEDDRFDPPRQRRQRRQAEPDDGGGGDPAPPAEPAAEPFDGGRGDVGQRPGDNERDQRQAQRISQQQRRGDGSGKAPSAVGGDRFGCAGRVLHARIFHALAERRKIRRKG